MTHEAGSAPLVLGCCALRGDAWRRLRGQDQASDRRFRRARQDHRTNHFVRGRDQRDRAVRLARRSRRASASPVPRPKRRRPTRSRKSTKSPPTRPINAFSRGWMFADSPGLHGIEHPVYDIWLTDCKGDGPLIHEAPEVADSAATGRARSGPRRRGARSEAPRRPPQRQRRPKKKPKPAIVESPARSGHGAGRPRWPFGSAQPQAPSRRYYPTELRPIPPAQCRAVGFAPAETSMAKRARIVGEVLKFEGRFRLTRTQARDRGGGWRAAHPRPRNLSLRACGRGSALRPLARCRDAGPAISPRGLPERRVARPDRGLRRHARRRFP